MNSKIRTAVLALLALAVVGILPASSQEKGGELPSLLTDQHKAMAAWAGDFETTGKMWMEPGADAVEFKSSAKRVSSFGGLFVRETYEVKDGPFPHQGEITWGYSPTTKKVQFMHVVSVDPTLRIFEGEWDGKSKKIEIKCTYKMSWEGKDITAHQRNVLEVESADKQTLTVFTRYEGIEGAVDEIKEAEINYTRKK